MARVTGPTARLIREPNTNGPGNPATSGVLFFGAEFSGGHVWVRRSRVLRRRGQIDDATFSGGEVTFDRAKFSGGALVFNNARFIAAAQHRRCRRHLPDRGPRPVRRPHPHHPGSVSSGRGMSSGCIRCRFREGNPLAAIRPLDK